MWGEFLDYEWYYEEAFVEPVVDPWRKSLVWAGQVVMIDRGIIERAVNKRQYQDVAFRDMDKVAEVRESIQSVGLERPLILVVDRSGWLVLKDGHHRLLATDGLAGYETLPCMLKTAEKIKVNAVHLSEVLFDLLV